MYSALWNCEICDCEESNLGKVLKRSESALLEPKAVASIFTVILFSSSSTLNSSLTLQLATGSCSDCPGGWGEASLSVVLNKFQIKLNISLDVKIYMEKNYLSTQQLIHYMPILLFNFGYLNIDKLEIFHPEARIQLVQKKVFKLNLVINESNIVR